MSIDDKASSLLPASATLRQPVPAAETVESRFPYILQNPSTNTLARIRTGRRNTHINQITGTATVTLDNVQLSLLDFENLEGGIRTSTLQLLDALTVRLTESGAISPTVILSLEEYMTMRGLSNRKEARKQVVADLEALFNARYSFKGRMHRGQPLDFLDVRICDAKGIKNGIITFSFGSVYYGALAGSPPMPYPAQLFRLNAKYNPHSFCLGRKITEHKNMNAGKKNEDTISVRTLLDACNASLPSYEEVLNSDRAFSKRIIEPFERDLNELEPIFTWQYCHRNGMPLSEEELRDFSYPVFIELLVKVFWRTYPDQTARLEAREQRTTETKTTKPKKSRTAKDKAAPKKSSEHSSPS